MNHTNIQILLATVNWIGENLPYSITLPDVSLTRQSECALEHADSYVD